VVQDCAQVSFAGDEYPVGAFGADGRSAIAFICGVWGAVHVDPGRPDGGVEGRGELGVPVADQR
jgi:hypothetical protein